LGSKALDVLAVLATALAAAGCQPSTGSPAAAATASRICSMNLAADEILVDLVDPARVVGVSAFVDNAGVSNVPGRYPAGVSRLLANAEKIVALRPDLVCVNPYNSADFVAQIEGAGIPVFRYENPTTFAAIRAGIVALGERVGESVKARALAERMDVRLDALAKRLASARSRPTVYYWAGAWTAGPKTTIHEMIERAGGVNLASKGFRAGMAQVSVERILGDDPDVLLLNDRQWIDGVPALEPLPPQFSSLRAVKEGRIVRLRPNLLSTLSHYVVDGAEALAKELHPECFPGEPESRGAR
jgi:iron complex transport system substrate-binding protein